MLFISTYSLKAVFIHSYISIYIDIITRSLGLGTYKLEFKRVQEQNEEVKKFIQFRV